VADARACGAAADEVIGDGGEQGGHSLLAGTPGPDGGACAGCEPGGRRRRASAGRGGSPPPRWWWPRRPGRGRLAGAQRRQVAMRQCPGVRRLLWRAGCAGGPRCRSAGRVDRRHPVHRLRRCPGLAAGAARR
jgi:hypothetical protein